jgi:hypothetical protein
VVTLDAWHRSRKFYGDLRQWWEKIGRPHPLASFMSNARKLNRVWPEIVTSGSKHCLPYQHYMQMAVCSLQLEQKQELRAWAEEKQPK